MKKLLLKVYLVWCVVVFTVVMVLFLPFFMLPLVFGEKRGGMIALAFIRAWAAIFSVLTQIRYKVVDRRKVDRKQTYIYVCNHNSYLDTPGMMLAIPGQFRPLGKVEMKKAPVFGWFYPYLVVMVDRSSPESRRRSIMEMKAKLRRGISIFIFPEGRMNRTPYPLTDFYDGAFRIAIETQTPVLPMVMLNSRRLMPRDRFEIRPGTIITLFLDPVSTAGLTMADVPPLKQQVYEKMKEKLEEGAGVVAI
jgi:1-acyl-sn-glycerol-3-phosphate acyltransferase